MTLEELQVKVTARTDGLESKLKGLNNKLTETGNVSGKVSGKVSKAFKAIDMALKASMIGAIVGIIAKVITAVSGFVGACTGLGSTLSEVQNVVDTTFGGMSSKVDDFTKNSIKDLGMSEAAAKKYVSTTGAILKSTGFDTGSALQMSEAMTQLTADMASFYNYNTDEMFTKIRGGLTGETEGLKELGINMSVANMEAYALSQGIKKPYDKMSQSEQTLLRYNYLLSVTKDSQGDLARTSNSWANQTRILKENWDQLKSNMGQGFINILTPVIKTLNTVIEKLQAIGDWFAKITGKIFGSQKALGGAGVADSVAGDPSIYDDATSGALSLGNAIDGAGDAAEKAGKKAKEAKKGLLSFDEINQLNDSSSSGDSGSGGSGSGGSDEADKLNGINNAYNDLSSGVSDLSNSVGKLKDDSDGWLDALLDDLDKISETIGDIISNILSIHPDMGLDWEKNKVVNEVTNKITKYLFEVDTSSARNAAQKCYEIQKKVDGLFKDKFYIKLGLQVDNTIGNMIDNIIRKLKELGSQSDSLKDGPIKRLWDFIRNSFKTDISAAFKWIVDSGKTSFSTLGSFLNACKITGENVGSFFKNVLTGNFSGAFDNIKTTGTAWKNHLVTCFDNMKTLCSNHTETLRSWVASKWQNMVQLVTGHSTNMKTKTTNDASTMKTKFGELGTFVSGTFAQRIGSGCTSITSKFSSMWSSIKSGCTGALNYMIDKINGLTSKLNSKLNFTMPSVLGGGHVGFSIPQIPRLARGGIVDSATIAMIGEAGKEAVIPLENNTGFLDALSTRLSNSIISSLNVALSLGSGQSSSNQTIILEVNGVQFARGVIDDLNKESRRVGLKWD